MKEAITWNQRAGLDYHSSATELQMLHSMLSFYNNN